MAGFDGDALGDHELVELVPRHLGNVDSLELLAVGVQKDGLRRLAGDLLELRALELLFKVLEDEFLHLFSKICKILLNSLTRTVHLPRGACSNVIQRKTRLCRSELWDPRHQPSETF